LAKPILQVHVFENSPHGKPFQHCVMMQLKYEDLASFFDFFDVWKNNEIHFPFN